jgi:hypothetical protein
METTRFGTSAADASPVARKMQPAARSRPKFRDFAETPFLDIAALFARIAISRVLRMSG